MERPTPRRRSWTLCTVWYGRIKWDLAKSGVNGYWHHDFATYDEDGKWERRVISYLGGLEVLKPNHVNVSKGTAKLAADDPLAWKGLPNLRAFFVDQVYADGESEREPGCLIIKACSSGWRWILKEPSQCLMLRIEGRTWDEACLLADAMLGDPDAPWELDPYEASRKGKKKFR